MNLTLRPETEQFIDEQIKAGRFQNPEDVVEAAIAEMRDIGAGELDDQTIAAINEAEDQADRGEGIDLDVFRAQISLQRPLA